MQLAQAVAGFAAVAAVVTVSPGVDTALVLRSTLTVGRRPAMWTTLGIGSGVLVWGAAGALGVSALLLASRAAYDVVRLVGAVYLLLLGGRLLVTAARGRSSLDLDAAGPPRRSAARSWLTGFTTNLANPKVGVFYLAVLPQFLVPAMPPVAMGLLLAGVHVALGTVWLGLLVLAADAASGWLRRPWTGRVIDAVAGTVLVGLGVRTALERA